MRIVGIFNAVVSAEDKAKKDGDYVNPVVREFQNLRSFIEGKLAAKDFLFQRDDMGDAVHNLNLLLGELLPAATLESTLPTLRDDYRGRVGADTYSAYLTSAGYKALDGCSRILSPETKLRLLRADYLQLINEIRRMTLLDYHVEETRSFLIRKLRRTLCKIVIAPVAIIILFALSCVAIIDVQKSVQPAPSPLTAGDAHDPNSIKLYPSPEAAVNSATHRTKAEPASALSRWVARYLMGNNPGEWTRLFKAFVLLTLLSFAAIAGAIGSFISALLRIEAVPETTEIGRSVVALRYSESIRLAPVTGMIFAILLSFVFGGQLLNGNLFPSAGTNSIWPFVLFIPAELAKWLVWCFIVGFSERLMPDMIDRLIARSDKGNQTPAPASLGRGNGKPSGPNGSNGTSFDSTRPSSPALHQRRSRRTRRRARVAAQ